MLKDDDVEFLQINGWNVQCESPLEIRHEDGGAFASGAAADYLIQGLRQDEEPSGEPTDKPEFKFGLYRNNKNKKLYQPLMLRRDTNLNWYVDYISVETGDGWLRRIEEWDSRFTYEYESSYA